MYAWVCRHSLRLGYFAHVSAVRPVGVLIFFSFQSSCSMYTEDSFTGIQAYQRQHKFWSLDVKSDILTWLVSQSWLAPLIASFQTPWNSFFFVQILFRRALLDVETRFESFQKCTTLVGFRFLNRASQRYSRSGCCRVRGNNTSFRRTGDQPGANRCKRLVVFDRNS